MPWKFPTRRFRDGTVINYEDFNEALRAFAEEEGKLNEHNFSNAIAAAVAASDLEDDVAWKIGSVSEECDIHDGAESGSPGVYSNEAVIPATELWTQVDGMSLIFVSTGAPHLFIFTGQHLQDDRVTLWATQATGAQFAIRVDGSVIPESVVGDLDYAQAGEFMERGMMAEALGFECRALVYLPPGLHVVDVVGRTFHLFEGADGFATLVGNRELIGMELGR